MLWMAGGARAKSHVVEGRRRMQGMCESVSFRDVVKVQVFVASWNRVGPGDASLGVAPFFGWWWYGVRDTLFCFRKSGALGGGDAAQYAQINTNGTPAQRNEGGGW